MIGYMVLSTCAVLHYYESSAGFCIGPQWRVCKVRIHHTWAGWWASGHVLRVKE